jgi:hypothetical protein
MPPAPPSTIRESKPMSIPNRVTLDDLIPTVETGRPVYRIETPHTAGREAA